MRTIIVAIGSSSSNNIIIIISSSISAHTLRLRLEEGLRAPAMCTRSNNNKRQRQPTLFPLVVRWR